MNYVLLTLAAVMFAGQIVFTKFYQARSGRSRRASFLYPVLAGGISTLFFLCLNGFHVEVSGFSVLMAALLAFFTSVTVVLGVVAVSYGRMAVYSLFLMLGGMLLPFCYGLIFLNEELSVCRGIGVVLLVVSLILPVLKGGEKQAGGNKKIFILLCLFIFLCNGGTSIVSKVHAIDPRATGTNDFLILAFAFVTVISAAVYGVFALTQRKKQPLSESVPSGLEPAQAAQKFGKKTLLLLLAFVAGYAISNGLGAMLQLICAESVPASALYPFTSGGTVVLSTIAGRIIFREKLSPLVLAGIALAFVATVLFVF